ncbi:MAG: ATP-dependent DNA helicase, partial [Acetobacter papayae]
MQSSFPSAHDAPALVPYRGGFSLLTEDGELLTLSAQALRERLGTLPPLLVVHAPALARRLGLPAPGQPGPWLDLLELFAFVHPARPAVPTPRGLAMALGLDAEALETIEADLLPGLLASLLNDLRQRNTGDEAEQLAAFCLRMAQAGWPWAGTVAETLELQNRLTPRGTLPEEALQLVDALR